MFLGLRSSVCVDQCVFVLCLAVFVHSCFIQPACLLPPDRQSARAPPQSFIGSYCHLAKIQYASIDCVEMQSGVYTAERQTI